MTLAQNLSLIAQKIYKKLFEKNFSQLSKMKKAKYKKNSK